MDIIKTFEEYLTQSSAQIPIIGYILNLILTGVSALILKHVYIRYSNTLSNRRLFGNNFILIAMTTMLIITIVKSSLALSLGLVGALSVIRFRAAIKEPEELAYLFLAISLGLGFGANQGNITIVALIIIAIIIYMLKKQSYVYEDNNNLNLTIMSQNPKEIDLEQIIEILKKHSSGVSIKRLDESEKVFEASFLVNFENYKDLIKTKSNIQKLDQKINITYLDRSNIIV